MNYPYGEHMNGWGVAATSISSVLLWVALVLGAAALLRYLRDPPRARVEEPEQLLAARYARGEVDDEEYHRRMDTLRHTLPPTSVRG
jgi:putative membrane protein